MGEVALQADKACLASQSPALPHCLISEMAWETEREDLFSEMGGVSRTSEMVYDPHPAYT